MRFWTYLLPAGLWLWLAKRECEVITIQVPVDIIWTGKVGVYIPPKRKA